MTENAIPTGGPETPETIHLVQLLLPLYRNDGAPVERAAFQEVREEMTDRFGGLTAYTRAPAEGLWKESAADSEAAARTTRDQIVVHEVMVRGLDVGWWQDYRRALERRFGQEALVVRAQAVTLL